ncbi:MAG: InlB B-repeat-containing protein [Oscillospiraceae bacterium]|nr:InlB B-repeat-containing protein [Oscillospiraceae bacterium]
MFTKQKHHTRRAVALTLALIMALALIPSGLLPQASAANGERTVRIVVKANGTDYTVEPNIHNLGDNPFVRMRDVAEAFERIAAAGAKRFSVDWYDNKGHATQPGTYDGYYEPLKNRGTYSSFTSPQNTIIINGSSNNAMSHPTGTGNGQRYIVIPGDNTSEWTHYFDVRDMASALGFTATYTSNTINIRLPDVYFVDISNVAGNLNHNRASFYTSGSGIIWSESIASGNNDPALYNSSGTRIADDENRNNHWRLNQTTSGTRYYAGSFSNAASSYRIYSTVPIYLDADGGETPTPTPTATPTPTPTPSTPIPTPVPPKPATWYIEYKDSSSEVIATSMLNRDGFVGDILGGNIVEDAVDFYLPEGYALVNIQTPLPHTLTEGENKFIALVAPIGPYTVTFDTSVLTGSVRDKKALEDQTLYYGDLVVNPGDPRAYISPNVEFAGWYEGHPDYYGSWDFEKDTIKGDMTLYAVLKDRNGDWMVPNKLTLQPQAYALAGGGDSDENERSAFILDPDKPLDGLRIWLDSEDIAFPKTELYTVAAYSKDGGKKWVNIKPEHQALAHPKNPFNSNTIPGNPTRTKNNFAKLLNKDLNLLLSDKPYNKKLAAAQSVDGIQGIPSDAAVYGFPTINKRPKFPKIMVNYSYTADWSGKTAGKWRAVRKDGKNALSPQESRDIQIGVSDPGNKKSVGIFGYGWYWDCDHEGACSDAPNSKACEGYPVEDKDKTADHWYFVRLEPKEHTGADDVKTYTAASKSKRILSHIANAGIKGIPKAPKVTAKTKKGITTIALKKGHMIFAGSEGRLMMTDGEWLAENMEINETKKKEITINPGDLIYAKADTIITLPEDMKNLVAWKAPTLKKPRSHISEVIFK